MTSPELVLPPTRHLSTAIPAALAALAVLALTTALLVDPLVASDMKPGVAALGALFAGTLAVVALSLGRGQGALWLDADGRLGLGVTGARDVWWLPRTRLAGLRMVAMPTAGHTIERWLLLIELNGEGGRDPLTIVLAESDARAFLSGIAARLADHLKLPYIEGGEEPAFTPKAAVEAYSVKRGAALQMLLLAFGTSLIAFSVLAFGQLEEEPIVGFLFAPILLVMGVCLVCVTLIKRLASETLESDGQGLTHSFSLGRLRWGGRRIKAVRPRFRMRLLGLRGALLEVVGDDGTLVLAAGATSRSRWSLDEVATLPSRVVRPTHETARDDDDEPSP